MDSMGFNDCLLFIQEFGTDCFCLFCAGLTVHFYCDGPFLVTNSSKTKQKHIFLISHNLPTPNIEMFLDFVLIRHLTGRQVGLETTSSRARYSNEIWDKTY